MLTARKRLARNSNPQPPRGVLWRSQYQNWTEVVTTDDVYNAFPGLCITPDDHALVTWCHIGLGQDPSTGTLYSSRTSDLTLKTGWSAPSAVVDHHLSGPGPLGCTLTVLANNHIVMVTWFSFGPDGDAYAYISTDNGVTWSAAAPITSAFTAFTAAQSPAVETNTPNHLIVASYGADTGAPSDFYVRLHSTTNGGGTWVDAGIAVAAVAGWQFAEPWITKLPGAAAHEYLMTIRVTDNLGNRDMYSSFTDDPTGLAGWSAPTLALHFVNGVPATFMTPEGDLALFTRDCGPVSGQWARMNISSDYGLTWGATQFLGLLPTHANPPHKTMSNNTMEYAQMAYHGGPGQHGSLLVASGMGYVEGSDHPSSIYVGAFSAFPTEWTDPRPVINTILAIPNLVDIWPLDEISGTTAHDPWGPNEGTHSGGVSFGAVLGLPDDPSTGTSYDGTGSTDFGGDNIFLTSQNGESFSISLLVFWEGFLSGFSDAVLSLGEAWQIWINSAGKLRLDDNNGPHVIDSATFPTRTLTQVGMTYNREIGQLKLYKNGAVVGSFSGGEYAVPGNFGLANYPPSPFVGAFADACFFNAQIADADMLAIAVAAGLA